MEDKVATAEAPHDHRLPPPADPFLGTGDDEEKGLHSPGQYFLPPANPKEIRNSQVATKGEQNIKMGNSQTTMPPDEDGASSTSTATASEATKLDFDLKVSMVLITASMIPLINILFLHGPRAKLSLTLKLSAFLAFTAFISAISLLFQTFKLMAIKPAQLIPKRQLRTCKILFATAATSLFLTYISITYSILPKAYFLLPLALLPSLLVAGFHLLYRPETGNGVLSPAQTKAHKKELKRATQLTLSLVSMSISGFVCVLLAVYHSNAARLDAARSCAKVSVYLLLGGGIAGILALLLCRLLSNIDNHQQQQSGAGTWQRAILTTANIVMVSMDVPAILIIAETILHALLAGVVFPVVLGASAWFLVEFCTAAGAGSSSTETEESKAAHGTMYAIALAVATLSFGTILAIFAGLLGGTMAMGGKEQFKASTFLLTSSFVSAVSLGAVTSGTAWAEKTKASTEFAAAVLASCCLGSLVLAALALFYQYQAVA